MNVVFIDGRIVPNTAKSSKNYVYQAANGEKKSYLHFLVSTRKEGAPKGENGYYPTMLKAMKAFGETADQINKNFGPGNYILAGNSSNGSFYMDGDHAMGLVFNQLSLINPDSAAINIQNGKFLWPT